MVHEVVILPKRELETEMDMAALQGRIKRLYDSGYRIVEVHSIPDTPFVIIIFRLEQEP